MLEKLEDIVFRSRLIILGFFAAFTIYSGYYATQQKMTAGFEKQLPAGHEYIQTFQEYRDRLFGSNRIIVVLKQREGVIWNKDYFSTYKDLTDALFYLPGVARHTLTSLWTPNSRYFEITEDGFVADDVIPGTITVDNLDEQCVSRLKTASLATTCEPALSIIENNVVRGGFVGRLVANDFSAAMVRAELLDLDVKTGERLNYFELAEKLESDIRAKFENDKYEVQIIGFAKLIGDIADGAGTVVQFFGVALILTIMSVYVYARSAVLTFLPLFCSLTSLVWQFGILKLLGYGLDPLAILVPFLVFAIGVSHGVQQINLITAEISKGSSSDEAARASFRGLLIPGSMALVTDLVGFGTLYFIPIQMIQELAITASIGVALKILTNLVMLPVMVSFFKIDDGFAARAAKARETRIRIMQTIGNVANPKAAIVIVFLAIALFVTAFIQSQDRHVGALHAGSPELRKEARYNEDSRAIADKFALGLNLLTVIVETPAEACINYPYMKYLNEFSWYLRNVEGVSLVLSLPYVTRQSSAGFNEGNLKWQALPRNKYALVQSVAPIGTSTGLLDEDCRLLTQLIFLDDAKATTIERVTKAVKTFRDEQPSPVANLMVITDPPIRDASGYELGIKTDVVDNGVDSALAITYDVKQDTPASLLDALAARGLKVTSSEVDDVSIRLASGNMGVQAAVNEEIEISELPMMMYVYLTIIALVILTYRDWRATIACCVPLTLATFMGYWFMEVLEIGLTVATLPVMVLAVGLGVDYAFYIYNRIQFHLSQGDDVTLSFKKTLNETGMAVVFTALTLAIGVSTWAFSALKFQADMGLLLAFMFMINMVMAVTVLPALAVVLEMIVPRKEPPKAPSGALAH
ncbi:MAG: efflux RND transporter permease subunit [Pseudomonadota bacterium]|nr:efflux RND transporter permease subunit [Pseudomonadota bacterium]